MSPTRRLALVYAALAAACTGTAPSADGPLLLEAIEPRVVARDTDAVIAIYGSFRVRINVSYTGESEIDQTFDATLGDLPLVSVEYASNARLTAVLPAGAPLGTHDLTVVDPYGRSATLPDAITVVATICGQAACTTYFRDGDGDGLGDDTDTICACSAAPPYTASVGGDCDDTFPGCSADCSDDDGNGVPDCAEPPPCGWGFRRTILIDATQVAADLTEFPVLIDIPADDALASGARADGADLRFTTSDGVTALSHELELFADATGELRAWVRVPVVSSSTDTLLYLYYGNADPSGAVDPTEVWRAYEAVYHLGTDLLDSTAQARHPTDNGSAPARGLVGPGRSFTPVSELALGTWNVAGMGITLQAWINVPDFTQDDPRIISKATTEQNQDHVFMLGLGAVDERHLRMRIKTGTSDTAGTTELAATSDPLNAETWQLVAGTYDGTTMRLILDGAEIAATAKTGSFHANGWEIRVANNANNALPAFAALHGRLDELRVASVARLPEWLATEYANQSSPLTFATIGVEEVRGAPCTW